MCLGVRKLGRDRLVNVVDGVDLACCVQNEQHVGVRQAALLKLDHVGVGDNLVIEQYKRGKGEKEAWDLLLIHLGSNIQD